MLSKKQTPHACQKLRIGDAVQNNGTNQFQSNIKIKPSNAPSPIAIINRIKQPIVSAIILFKLMYFIFNFSNLYYYFHHYREDVQP